MCQRYSYGCTPTEVILAATKGERFPMSFPTRGADYDCVVAIVNQGIDSHLEAMVDTKHAHVTEQIGTRYKQTRLNLDLSPEDLLVFLRRCLESESDEAMGLRTSILSCLGIEEI